MGSELLQGYRMGAFIAVRTRGAGGMDKGSGSGRGDQ